tara:strand:+ start:35 stop:331 length:297 start_codon:yes stop_codon:yes gene_type:complete
MNEHTWEKLDADMRSDMADEYIQERCPHEDLYVNNITVKIQSEPIGDYLHTWKRYLATQGTELFELYAEVVCEKCGATQEQYIDIDEILETKTWEWEE